MFREGKYSGSQQNCKQRHKVMPYRSQHKRTRYPGLPSHQHTFRHTFQHTFRHIPANIPSPHASPAAVAAITLEDYWILASPRYYQ